MATPIPSGFVVSDLHTTSAEFSTQTRKQLRTPQPEFKEFVESGRWKEWGTKAKETEATQAGQERK